MYTDDDWAELQIAFRFRRLYTLLDGMSRLLAIHYAMKPHAFTFDCYAPFILLPFHLEEISACRATVGINN